MNKFSKSLITLCLASCALSFNTAHATSTEANYVVGTYTKDTQTVILYSDIKPFLAVKKDGSSYTQAEIEKATQKFVLKQLNDQVKKDADKNVTVSQAEINNAVAQIAKNNKMSVNDLIFVLEYNGTSRKTFENDIKKQILEQKKAEYIHKQAVPSVDHETLQFEGYKNYEIDKANGTIKKVDVPTVSYIIKKVTPVADAKAVQEELKKVYNDLNAKKMTFETAALEYSDDVVSAANNGKFGILASTDAPIQVMLEKIQKLKPGQVTQPFEIQGLGWAIVRYDGNEQVEASLDYYINQEYQKLESKLNSINNLDDLLLSTVTIKYVE